MAYISIEDQLPPLDTLVRTHNGNPNFAHKAMLKNDGWYYPSGETQLPWVPTHWKEN